MHEPLSQRLIVLAVCLLLLAAGAGLAINASAQVRNDQSTPLVIESDRPLETSATPPPAPISAATTLAAPVAVEPAKEPQPPARRSPVRRNRPRSPSPRRAP